MSRREELRALAAETRARVDAPQNEPAPDVPAPKPKQRESRASSASSTSRPRRHPSVGTSIKVTMSVPPKIVDALRARANQTGRSLGDVLLTALIDGFSDVQSRCDDDARRIQLGLPPISLTQAGERTALTVRLPEAGLAELDKAAASLALNRSDLAAALVAETLAASSS